MASLCPGFATKSLNVKVAFLLLRRQQLRDAVSWVENPSLAVDSLFLCRLSDYHVLICKSCHVILCPTASLANKIHDICPKAFPLNLNPKWKNQTSAWVPASCLVTSPCRKLTSPTLVSIMKQPSGRSMALLILNHV